MILIATTQVRGLWITHNALTCVVANTTQVRGLWITLGATQGRPSA